MRRSLPVTRMGPICRVASGSASGSLGRSSPSSTTRGSSSSMNRRPNLDTVSEEGVVRRLVEDTHGAVTTLLVTHRLALARRADQICVVADGRVAERGTHDELIRAGGRYADAFAMQASLYPLEEAGA